MKNNWFKVKVIRKTTAPSGKLTKVTQEIALEAVNYTDAETRATEFCSELSGLAWQTEIVKMKLDEVYLDGPLSEDPFFMVRVEMITFDEENGKEKRDRVSCLVNSQNITQAKEHVEQSFSDSVSDWEIVSITKTKILEAVEL